MPGFDVALKDLETEELDTIVTVEFKNVNSLHAEINHMQWCIQDLGEGCYMSTRSVCTKFKLRITTQHISFIAREWRRVKANFELIG